MEKLKAKKKEIKVGLIITLVIIAFIGLYIYNTTLYVIVRFDELGPLSKNMATYYNGFKVGKITNIGPDKDFKHTLVKVKLTQKDLNLPQNISVYVERFPNGELYLQFIYPQSPSLKKIKKGDVLEGIAPYSLEQFMLGQNISGVTDVVSLHVIKALNATEVANMEMTAFFKNTSKLINENRKSINQSVNNVEDMTENLAEMAKNLNQTSKKLNNSINETAMNDTAINVKNATKNIAEATKDIDKTVKKIDATVTQANAAAENLNSMTSGLNQTLSQRFGGMKIMFGTPVKQKNCVKNACN